MILAKGASRRLFLCLLVLPLSIMAAANESACPKPAYDEIATVINIHDGDTVKLADGRNIRLIGINTPEVARDARPAEAYALQARDHLAQRLQQHEYRVGLVYGAERLDRHKRTLAHLFAGDGLNLQADLLENGLAAAITFPPNLAFSDCYHQLERTARCARKAIWSEPASALQASRTLAAGSAGFHILQGTIEHIRITSRGAWLELEGGVSLHIAQTELASFSELASLQAKRVEVRGWLIANKKPKAGARFFMRVRHPSALRILDGTDYMAKC